MTMAEDLELPGASLIAEVNTTSDARRTRASADELLGVARRCAALVKHPIADHAALLYDEHGLPK